jgi:hypothetical protein
VNGDELLLRGRLKSSAGAISPIHAQATLDNIRETPLFFSLSATGTCWHYSRRNRAAAPTRRSLERLNMTASALILAVTISAPFVDTATGADQPRAATTLAAAIAATPVAASEPWMFDRKVSRPAAVKVMYGTLAALQALDIYSTTRALNQGASEANPIVATTTANQGAMLAMKAVSTATTVYFAERAWKKNPRGAVVLMAVVNGVTAAVVAHNLRNAR